MPVNQDYILLKGIGLAFLIVSLLLITLGVKAHASPEHFDYALVLIPFFWHSFFVNRSIWKP